MFYIFKKIRVLYFQENPCFIFSRKSVFYIFRVLFFKKRGCPCFIFSVFYFFKKKRTSVFYIFKKIRVLYFPCFIFSRKQDVRVLYFQENPCFIFSVFYIFKKRGRPCFIFSRKLKFFRTIGFAQAFA